MLFLTTVAIIILASCAVSLFAVIISLVALYKMFEKAGVEGWKSLIPFYNLYIMTKEIGKLDEIWFFLTFLGVIPVIGTLISGIALLNINYSVVRRFTKESDIRILGTIFFPIYSLFAGFGSATYDNSDMNKNGFFHDSTIESVKGNHESTGSSSSFCKNCGNKVNSNDKFCQNCGNKL